jgi:hypothetical protein
MNKDKVQEVIGTLVVIAIYIGRVALIVALIMQWGTPVILGLVMALIVWAGWVTHQY